MTTIVDPVVTVLLGSVVVGEAVDRVGAGVGTGAGIGVDIEMGAGTGAGAVVFSSKAAIGLGMVVVAVVRLVCLALRASRRARTVAKVVRMWSGNGLVFLQHHAISISRS
jgi:hypothetical protein